MARAMILAAAVLLAPVTHASAGARRIVWLDPDASGTRPLLGLFPSAAAARACREAMARGRGEQGEPPGVTTDAAGRAVCGHFVGLRHGTRVEFMPPPGSCGEGLQKVRVLDGTYRGRIGCVRADALRVH